MTEVFSKALIPIGSPEGKEQLKRREEKLITVITGNEKEVEELVKKGYTVQSSKNKIFKLTSPKSKEDEFEDRIWRLMYRLGFLQISPKNFNVTYDINKGLKKEIDVFVRDKGLMFAIECRYIGKDQNLRDYIRSINEYYKKMRDTIDKAFNVPVYSILFTTKKELGENEKIEATEGVFVFDEKALDYFESLCGLIGEAAKYQFLASILKGQQIPKGEIDPVVALKTKLNGMTLYSFFIKPNDLLKIAYVHHRKASSLGERFLSYQRIIKPDKIRKLEKFIHHGNFFPNSVILNFTEEPVDMPIHAGVDENISVVSLELPRRYASAWIVDGQHRLYGYANLKEERSNGLLPVTAFLNMSEKDQGSLFIEINRNQTPVDPNLLWDLYDEIYEGLEDNDENYDALVLRTVSRIAKRVNGEKTSPLYNRIMVQSEKRKPVQKIKISMFCHYLNKTSVLKNEFKDFSWSKKEELVSQYISAFFTAIKNMSENEWKYPSEGWLWSQNGYIILSYIFRDVVRYISYKEETLELKYEKLVNDMASLLAPMESFVSKFDDEIKKDYRASGSDQVRKEHADAIKAKIKEKFKEFAPDLDYERLNQKSGSALIKAVELEARTFIKRNLIDLYGELWLKNGVPVHLQDKANKRYDQDKDKYPYIKSLGDEGEKRLAMLDVIDLATIVTSKDNWAHFRHFFGEKDNTIRKFEQFQAYRNMIQHYREDTETDEIKMTEGQIATKWVHRCITATKLRPKNGD